MLAQTSSAITSVRMSHKCPAIPSGLSPADSPEVNNSVSNRMFLRVTIFLGYVAFYTDLLATEFVACSIVQFGEIITYSIAFGH